MKKFTYSIIIIFIILLNVSFSYAKIPEIVLNQKRAVVTVYINDKDGKQISTGSGFVIDSNGIIATNYHVVSACVEDGNTLLIKMENGAFFPLINILNYDEENDVAIFKVDGKELPTVKLAKNYKPKQGEDIVVVGSPLGLETTVSDGIISSIRGKDGIIQITAPVSPGSSGSPVLNSTGEVIGVATFNIGGKQGGQSLNFAIPVKHVVNLLKGTKKPKKKGIVNSEQNPVATPSHSYEGLTAVELYKKAYSLWDGEKYTDAEKALEYLSIAIKLQPNFADAYNLRGNAYQNLSQYQRAIEDYNEALRLKSDYTFYFNRGRACLNLGQHERAIKDLNEAIHLQPNFALGYINRAYIYTILGQYERAIKDNGEVIRLQPDSAKVSYYNIACLFALQNDATQSCTWLQLAIERGFNDWKHIREDKDFDNIRKTDCFINLLKESEK